jgi:hypothetical protein
VAGALGHRLWSSCGSRHVQNLRLLADCRTPGSPLPLAGSTLDVIWSARRTITS